MASGKIWLSLALAAIVASVPRDALCQTTSAPTTSAAPVAIPQPAVVLADPTVPAAQRDQAADLLAADGSSTAIAALAGALAGRSNPAAQLSAAKALAGNPKAEPALLEPLLALLSSGD